MKICIGLNLLCTDFESLSCSALDFNNWTKYTLFYYFLIKEILFVFLVY